MSNWKDFVKRAQLDFGWPQAAVAFTPDKKVREEQYEYWKPGGRGDMAQRQANNAGLIGAYRAAKELVPDFIDFGIGNVAGIANGSWHALTGRPFHEGFNASKDFVKKQYSDRLRNLEMAMGGNAIRDALYSERDNLDLQARMAAGNDPDKVKAYEADRKMLDDGSGYVQGMTGTALSFPAWAAFSSLGLTPGGAVANLLSRAGKIGPKMSTGITFAADGATLVSPDASKKLEGRSVLRDARGELRWKLDNGYGTDEEWQRISEEFPDMAPEIAKKRPQMAQVRRH